LTTNQATLLDLGILAHPVRETNQATQPTLQMTTSQAALRIHEPTRDDANYNLATYSVIIFDNSKVQLMVLIHSITLDPITRRTPQIHRQDIRLIHFREKFFSHGYSYKLASHILYELATP
jgi:hypothetical protein